MMETSLIDGIGITNFYVLLLLCICLGYLAWAIIPYEVEKHSAKKKADEELADKMYRDGWGN